MTYGIIHFHATQFRKIEQIIAKSWVIGDKLSCPKLPVMDSENFLRSTSGFLLSCYSSSCKAPSDSSLTVILLGPIVLLKMNVWATMLYHVFVFLLHI